LLRINSKIKHKPTVRHRYFPFIKWTGAFKREIQLWGMPKFTKVQEKKRNRIKNWWVLI
jgi:hypothetical protein